MATKPRFWMIANAGTYRMSQWACQYPRHMVLAQHFMFNKNYREMVMAVARTYKPDIILDNGAHEAEQVRLDDLFTAATYLEPTYLVLPDLIGQRSTFGRHRQLIFAGRIQKVLPFTKLIYVPQGDSADDVLSDFGWAIRVLDPNIFLLAFGDSYLHFEDPLRGEDARASLINKVAEEPRAREFTYHILGARWISRDWTEQFNRLSFLGIDSAKPVNCALNRMVYPTKPATSLPMDSEASASADLLEENVKWFEAAFGLR